MKTETIDDYLKREGKIERVYYRELKKVFKFGNITPNKKPKTWVTTMKKYEENKIITMNEACDYLSLKQSRIRSMVHLKQIPYIKLGASIRFELDELKKWVKSNSVKVGMVK